MKFKLIIDPDQEEQVVVTAKAPSPLTEELERLVSTQAADRIPAYTEDEMMLLEFSQIECITVLSGKTYAIDTAGKQYRLKLRLYELEAILPPYFIRINKSALANEKRLERFRASFSGCVDAVFRCGWKEYVSRRCYAAIKRRYGS